MLGVKGEWIKKTGNLTRPAVDRRPPGDKQHTQTRDTKKKKKKEMNGGCLDPNGTLGSQE